MRAGEVVVVEPGGKLLIAKAPHTVIQRAMHIHPTVAEYLPTILGKLEPFA